MTKTAILAAMMLASVYAKAQSTIKVDGSSTVFPITEAIAEEFQKSKSGAIQVTVGISGTGGGFKKFCRGETDVQDASRPITKEEMATCREAGINYYEFPIAYDAITIVVHPSNPLNEISVADLKKMWEPGAQGKVKKWNQVNPKWADAPLKLYGAGSDSGTFDYFTESLIGKAKSSRGDYTGSEDDNTLVQGVSNDKNALGYIPYAYYEPNKKKLKALAIIGGEKAPKKTGVLPNAANVESGSYFPLSRPIFIYVSEKAAQKNEVKEFTDYYLKNVSEMAKQVKYIPLPQKAYSLATKNFKTTKLGTAFAGEPQVGVRIEDLLKREAKF